LGSIFATSNRVTAPANPAGILYKNALLIINFLP
jgi:hypothetical protein